ncbi:MAG: molybdenum cofactor synthesis domain protein [Acidimicrobiaceae bacterium]|nr:molybdenum cofactor synthesis domain protein [Acidimicrobiaceae bacterium]
MVPYAAKLLTVSDRVSAGERSDEAGPAVRERLERLDIAVAEHRLVPDGVAPVREAVAELAKGFTGLILTIGGTGLSPRDLTPEATEELLERSAPGFAEVMRAASPLGPLSRGVSGTIGRCLVLNLPGSTRGATESLEAVIGLLPHALELLAGGDPHPAN